MLRVLSESLFLSLPVLLTVCENVCSCGLCGHTCDDLASFAQGIIPAGIQTVGPADSGK